MSRLLSELLQAQEPAFESALKKLEHASGNPSVDVRLTAEITGKVHMKMRELGLDPHDSTGEELYHALQNIVKIHDQFLAAHIGITGKMDSVEVLSRLRHVIEKINVPKEAWVIKHSSAKRLIKAMVPRKTMRHLGYRSIDSMLKREPIEDIYVAVRLLEAPEWLQKFTQSYKKLNPSDFEVRQIAFLQPDTQKWGGLGKAYIQSHRHNILHLKELGVIAVLPLPIKQIPGLTLTILPLLIHYVNEIRTYSAYFKLQQVRPDFSERLVNSLLADNGGHALMAGQPVHWRVIQRYFGLPGNQHPENFEPHVQSEDLSWQKAEDVIYRFEPALSFWRDMDYVAVHHGDRAISFNLLDNAVSFINRLPYEERATQNFRQALWHELSMRYLSQPGLRHQVLKQLDDQPIKPHMRATVL